ncbi:MAG: hypothetical protein V4579_05465 [Pseudomonadota bacterium]
MYSSPFSKPGFLRRITRAIPVTETILAGIVAGGVLYCLWHVAVYHYLPQPFFYEPDDLFADWFNTAYWSRDPGTYDAWKTLYPPISFVFLRLFGIASCYPSRRSFNGSDLSFGLPARECDWLGMATMFGVFFLNLVLIYLIFRKWNKPTALQRTICLGLGLPMLDGLERGNLVLVSFNLLLLAFGPLIRSARLRWLCAGLAVNFKVYLIAPILALLIKRKWRWVESALIATVLVYLASYALLGRGTPKELYDNIVFFANLPAMQILDFWYSTTYEALLSLMRGDFFPFILLIGSRNLSLALFVIPLLQHVTQALIVLAAAAAWLRPECATSYRVINLSILLVLVTTEPGGYTQTYFMLFTLLEPWKGGLQKAAIVGCYLLAIPLDYPIDHAADVVRDTYFGHSTQIIAFKVMLGPFIRPLIIMLIAQCLAVQTIRDVTRDVWEDGWASRWRFRHDAPLLPMVERPRRDAR